MTGERAIPLPPIELRRMVTNLDSEFDHPNGELVYPDLAAEVCDAVFDFGCGCGRIARKLLQQDPRPRRYVGIDVHRQMIDWCTDNLSRVEPAFQFCHHDVYSPGYGRDNSYRLAEAFPVGDQEFSLVVAASVFTHLYKQQAKFYLYEIARILRRGGIAVTSWFFFDRDSFPFLREGPHCLYVSEVDPTTAVIYDRRWFVETIRRCGLGVRSTILPRVAGQAWGVYLEKRSPDTVDRFPLGEDGAEWLCGASRKAIAEPAITQAEVDSWRVGPPPPTPADFESSIVDRQVPALFGAVAELAAVKRSWTWRIGRVITRPFGVIKGVFS